MHSLLIWWVTVCWLGTVLWIVWGGIGYRRREVARLRVRLEKEREEQVNPGFAVARDESIVGEMGQLVAATEASTDRPADANTETSSGMNGRILQQEEEPVGIKQYRTLMVLNIPPDSEFIRPPPSQTTQN